ncbi:MAG: hypothetical protein HOC70_14595 [Gammaproteobacteria bacterium]|jgi:beta-carotene hydroxylase|nr:hypothetical protein [Gammaproteobacteria bacterium]MBT4494468.1 hypothetical protein [Gammaproteobacteria bacterium]MBT7369164.1 hypothetical protein [Gammaproteobacteria bacterium]
MSLGDTTADSGEEALDQLKVSPVIAWPTIALFLTAVVLAAVSTTAYIENSISLATAIFLNTVASYFSFTVLHEASHNAISRTKSINDWVGRIACAMIFPMPIFQSFRFIHMQHHRFTNEPGNDPDKYALEKSVWLIPIKWSTIDFSYLKCYFLENDFSKRPAGEQRGFWIAVAYLLGLPVIAWQFGVFELYFFLYLVPLRLALFIVVWMFDYIPHYGCESTQRENPFRASLNRPGLEWILTPLFLSQNYHLVHHLYPTVPFYRYLDAWQARENYHLSQNPATADTFHLGPRNPA